MTVKFYSSSSSLLKGEEGLGLILRLGKTESEV